MLELFHPQAQQAAVTYGLSPIKLRASSDDTFREVPLTLGCVNHDGSNPWLPNDVKSITVPDGGLISLYGVRDCGGGDTWVGSGTTDLGILGLRNKLYSLKFVRWTEQSAGATPFTFIDQQGNTKNFPAKNDVINFGDPFPDNALRKVVVPTGYAIHVFDDFGCRFTSSNRYFDAGTYDLADYAFEGRASSAWTIRLSLAATSKV